MSQSPGERVVDHGNTVDGTGRISANDDGGIQESQPFLDHDPKARTSIEDRSNSITEHQSSGTSASSSIGDEKPHLHNDYKSDDEKFPVDVTEEEVQVLARKSLTTQIAEWPWYLESIILVVGCGLLAAAFAVLCKHNGREQPKWPSGITLNTLLSVISVIFRACLSYVLATVIGQTKWNWFTRSRTLDSLEVMDKASRGPWGCLVLLAKVRELTIAHVAAIFVIVSLATGPLIQQSMKIERCELKVNNNASISVAHLVPVTDATYAEDLQWRLYWTDMGAIINSLSSPTVNASTTPFDCPTGSCVFPEHDGITHSTMGVCSVCQDVTEHIDVIKPTPTDFGGPTGAPVATLIPDMKLTLTHMTNVTTGNLSWLEQNPFQGLASQALVNVSVLTATAVGCKWENGGHQCATPRRASFAGLDERSVIATTCSMYPCLKQYNGRVQNGTLVERLVNSIPAQVLARYTYDPSQRFDTAVVDPRCLSGKPDEDQQTNFDHLPGFMSAKNTSIVILQDKAVTVPSTCVYMISRSHMSALSHFLRETLQGSCRTSFEWRAGCQPQWWLAGLYNEGNATFESIRDTFDALSITTTNNMRSAGQILGTYNGTDWSLSFPFPTGRKSEVLGQAFLPTVCVRFDWKWLLFPATLLVLVAVVFVNVVLLSIYRGGKYIPVWKSSSLPLVLRGDPSNVRDMSAALPTLKELEKDSEELMIRLHHDDGSCNLEIAEKPRKPKKNDT